MYHQKAAGIDVNGVSISSFSTKYNSVEKKTTPVESTIAIIPNCRALLLRVNANVCIPELYRPNFKILTTRKTFIIRITKKAPELYQFFKHRMRIKNFLKSILNKKI